MNGRLPESLRAAILRSAPYGNPAVLVSVDDVRVSVEGAWPDVVAEVRGRPSADEWADEVRDWFYTYSNGLDCAGAHEAQHFEDWYQAIKADPSVAVDALVSTARYLGHGNDDMLAEVVALLRRLTDRPEVPR